MHSPRALLSFLGATLLGLALAAGCSSNRSGNMAQSLMGPDSRGARAANGLTLTAEPTHVFINTNDPSTPTDPNHGDERYGETILSLIATDPDGNPQADLEVSFGATAGVLSSAGAPRRTDAEGRAADTLRVFESDPATIQVSVTDGDRITIIDVTKSVSEPPVANAGPDQTVECTGNSSAQVHLDGSGSSDPNSDIALYEWFEHYGTAEQVLLDKGMTADVVFALGEHTVTLRVTDATGMTSTDEVAVKVVDTTPPVVELSLSPHVLWPPNHQMVDVEATLKVEDCQPTTVMLVSITSNEPDNGLGDGDTEGDIDAEIGSSELEFDLRAERSGLGTGRVYTVVYRVTDAGGLSTTVTAEVRVPHDANDR